MYLLRKIAKQHEIIMINLCCPVLRYHGNSEGRIWAVSTRSGYLTSASELHISPRKSAFDPKHLKCVSPHSQRAWCTCCPFDLQQHLPGICHFRKQTETFSGININAPESG